MVKEFKKTFETKQGLVSVTVKLGAKTEIMYQLPQAMSGAQFMDFKKQNEAEISGFISECKKGNVYNGKVLIPGAVYEFKGNLIEFVSVLKQEDSSKVLFNFKSANKQEGLYWLELIQLRQLKASGGAAVC